jgi:multisubunit Na+/H+ antiporter MnhF subunit
MFLIIVQVRAIIIMRAFAIITGPKIPMREASECCAGMIIWSVIAVLFGRTSIKNKLGIRLAYALFGNLPG